MLYKRIMHMLVLLALLATHDSTSGYPQQAPCSLITVKNAVANALRDGLTVNKNMVSVSTYKILAVTLPFFVAAGMAEDRLHSVFYDPYTHKNVGQWDQFFYGFSQYGIAFPVFFACSAAVAARDDDLKMTSRAYLVGLPFVMLTCDFIKACKFGGECSYRPWNEWFCAQHRARGGFPSGHMALATYTATLYGMRFGVRYAVPLGAYAALVGASFINYNRHYLSQVVAGAALGAMYACAASSLVDEKLAWLHERNMHVGLDATASGAPAVNICVRF